MMKSLLRTSSSKLAWLGACLVGSAAAIGSASCSAADAEPEVDPICKEQSTADLYEQRIEPLLVDDQPKSCNQCHLSGVDLSLFVRATPCQTMACLIERDLVDLKTPENSLILQWISRADPQSDLITDEVIQKEYDGFLEWIEYSARCQGSECAGVTCGSDEADPFCEVEKEPRDAITPENDPGDCEDRTIEELFRNTVYASRARCFPCHFTGEEMADKLAPRWVEQDGSCDAASLATMRNVIDAGYVDTTEPANSELLLKPLAEKDGGLEHGGHDKFRIEGDPGYTNFLYWLTRYAECRNSGALSY